MTARLISHWHDWVQPGSPDDSRLLHSDPSDYISVCRPQFGQGYIQDILLRDDLWIVIRDYTPTADLVMNVPGGENHIQLDFSLAEPVTGYALFGPHFGYRQLHLLRSQQRCFRVGVFFRFSTMIFYLKAFMERLSPHARSVAERVSQAMYRHHGGGSRSTLDNMLSRVIRNRTAAESYTTFEQVVPDALHTEMVVLNYATRTLRTPAMAQVIGRILSCPYQGKIRRTYLERQALKLVSLYLEAIEQPRLSEADLNSVYEAATILRHQLPHPPTLEALARQVCTNRLKLKQGFRAVYGTTPHDYLHDCRMQRARQLLTTSDLSVGDVAATVGYTCHSHFSTAFRRKWNLNPKVFQMQVVANAS
ncbi:MAG: helix-turn-helix transcriptional regulator [Cyanobacteria bacterium P01_D01_bin.14]